jgi:hypothetical protein
MRLTKLALAAVLAAGVSACSGSNGASSLSPLPVQQSAASVPSQQSIAQAPGKAAQQIGQIRIRPMTATPIAGPIRSVSTNAFTIYVESGCSGHGLLNIYFNSYTKFYNYSKPSVGQNASVTVSSGSCTTKILAATVTLSNAYSSTSSQQHVLTGDFLGSPYGATTVAYSTAARYLSWAQVSPWIANSVAAAGIKTQYYADPNQTLNDGDVFYTSTESTFAHTCSGSRVSGSYDGHTIYQMAIGGSPLQSLWTTVLDEVVSSAHYDAIFVDGDGTLASEHLSSTPCNYSDSYWLYYQRELHQLAPRPIIFNGLELFDGKNLSLTLQLLPTSNTMGGNFEYCYSASSVPEITGWIWANDENTELAVAAQHKLFQCSLRNTLSAASQTRARIYALASFLLSYNPSTSVLLEEFYTPSKFHVFPESQLVALDPVVATPSAISGLERSGGTYAREYYHCYYKGTYVGRCAAVVNPSPTDSHPFPFTTYKHTLAVSGYGVADGGTASIYGSAPPSSLAPGEAAIVFP